MKLHCKHSLALVIGVVTALTFVSGASAVVKKKNAAGQPAISKVVKVGAPAAQVLRKGKYVEGEVLVKYKTSLKTSANERANMVSRLGVRELRHLNRQRTLQVRLPQGQTVEQALQAFARDPDVERAQPNIIYRPLRVPGDPEYTQQWGFRNTAQTVTSGEYPTRNPGTPGSDMSLEQAWDEITDCRPVVVAVIDTGVNYTHRDLVNNMWNGGVSFPNHGFDTLDNDYDPMPTDASSHGTHVAATIAAEGNNIYGGTGVCWRAQIMAVRALAEYDAGDTTTVAAGVNWAVDRGAHVINISWGTDIFDPTLYDAITYARDHGVVVVAAAGNETVNNDSGSTPTYPCNFNHNNLICVAALDQAFNLATFSNYGATSVDVGAPGTNVLSAWAGAHVSDNAARAGAFLGWTSNGNWGLANCGAGQVSVLANPGGSWCSGGPYANNADDHAYTTLNMSAATASIIWFEWLGNLDTNLAYFDFGVYPGGGDPFTQQPGTAAIYPLPSDVNSTNDLQSYAFVDDVNFCNSATCSFGFRLQSFSASAYRGLGIFEVVVDTLVPNSDYTHVMDGTSTATPHVAGLAAMLRAYNPNYTYLDTVESIKNGGRAVPALTNVTTTGRAADAWGSLRYIKAPTGVAAVLQ